MTDGAEAAAGSYPSVQHPPTPPPDSTFTTVVDCLAVTNHFLSLKNLSNELQGGHSRYMCVDCVWASRCPSSADIHFSGITLFRFVLASQIKQNSLSLKISTGYFLERIVWRHLYWKRVSKVIISSQGNC